MKLITAMVTSIALLTGASSLYAAGLNTNDQENTPPCGDDWIYPTNGVHSDCLCTEQNNYCVAERNDNDPIDPSFPDYWMSEWTMYTITNEAASKANPPPYSSPPSTLTPSDYIVSYGASYYDSKWRPKKPTDKEDVGAMLEYYDKFCLPIFGRTIEDNQHSCAFVSLGKQAYYLTFPDGDNMKTNSSKQMLNQLKPDCCMFSPSNHPPRTDFIKHLDYWPQASQNLNSSVQAYYWKQMWEEVKPPILFAYAFYKPVPAQLASTFSKLEQNPQSFFFTGSLEIEGEPLDPMVSQNYVNFQRRKPNTELWDSVKKWCPIDTTEKCRLFSDQRSE
ncbi:hypothetical protein L1D55_19060 [Vibrio sp. Isolate22]|uniref:hypothetical protein n=1 Tax=Vibrio TaxID=662 RepID=UPI00165E1184|nr:MULTISPECIES: hypothetical protein [Vibrio]MCG9693817.1 hypothetical protein [Vibrio sp. Isolate22]